MNGFSNPVITPVLDLSQVTNGARELNSLLGSGALQGNSSYLLGSSIAASEVSDDDTDAQTPVVQEIQFVQNNNSPEH